MAKDKKTNPTVLQLDIVGLWVQGLSTREIADTLNCTPEHVRQVKKNDEFKQIFFERQREAVTELIPFAIKRLKNIIRDDEVSPATHIQAAREIFSMAHLDELTDKPDNEIKVVVVYE
jgi:hypothetical protein